MGADRGRRHVGIWVVLLLLTTNLAGCGQSCTDVACSDRVTVQVPDNTATAWGSGRFVAELCLGDLCNSKPLRVGPDGLRWGQEPELFAEPGTFDTGRTHTVSLTVADRDGNVVYFTSKDAVTLATHQPNGSRCPPTCATAVIGVDPAQPTP